LKAYAQTGLPPFPPEAGLSPWKLDRRVALLRDDRTFQDLRMQFANTDRGSKEEAEAFKAIVDYVVAVNPRAQPVGW
jgi:hypothetical protein